LPLERLLRVQRHGGNRNGIIRLRCDGNMNMAALWQATINQTMARRHCFERHAGMEHHAWSTTTATANGINNITGWNRTLRCSESLPESSQQWHQQQQQLDNQTAAWRHAMGNGQQTMAMATGTATESKATINQTTERHGGLAPWSTTTAHGRQF
jgi:hypothetical protein